MRKAILVASVAGFAILAAGHCYFRYSDIQSSRFTYWYQSRILGGENVEAIRRSYTGTWRIWFDDGNLMSEQQLVSGNLDGEYRNLFRSGRTYQEGEMRYGKVVRLSEWTESGQLIASGIFRDGRPFEGSFIYSRLLIPPGAARASITTGPENTFLERYSNGEKESSVLLSDLGVFRADWPN